MNAPATQPGRIVFVVTEDWFFASHFLPMARAAREMGLDVVVVARERVHRATIEATGARLIALEAERSSLNPLSAWSTISRLRAILADERPDIVHCIALRSILIGALAARLAGIRRRVHALTGLGFLGARQDAMARLVRATLRLVLRGPLDGPYVRHLFENADDAASLGFRPGDPRVVLVGGAGVDPEIFVAQPMPATPPLKVALVARMLWSKGVDLAVEAVLDARRQGADVTLSLYGARDPDNPKAIPQATLDAWAAQDGIVWHGPTRAIADVWAGHHVACLPSRGGEGLPRTLLEAAACGRAVITTDVPGCRDLIRDGIEGRIVPADDIGALAKAMIELAADPARVAEMGAAARARILSGYTERHVMEAVKTMYGKLLAARG